MPSFGFAGRIKEEHVFLALALLFGVLWVFLIPPFQLPDEEAHFIRAWSLSDGRLFVNTVKDPDGKLTAGGYVPVGVAELPDDLGARIIRRNPYRKYDFNLFREFVGRLIKTNPDYSQKVFAKTSAEMYSPIPYLPQAVGIIAGRALGASPIVCFYYARILVMLVYAFLVFLAVKITPVGKNLFMIVGLLPMSVALSVSVGADAITNGSVFLFTAYMLRLSLTDTGLPLTKGKIASVFGLLAVVALLKQPYLVLALLVLAVPAGRFRKNGARYLFVASALFFTLAVSAAWNIHAIAITTTYGHNSGPLLIGNPLGQVGFIVTHPIDYLAALYNGLFHYKLQGEGRGLLRQFLGLLGWLDLVFPAFFYYFLGFFLLAQVLVSQGLPHILSRGRAVMLLTALAAMVGTATAIYLVNAVGSDTIVGLQGRYFTPIAPLALVAVSHMGIDAFDSIAYKVFRGPWFVGTVMAVALSFATWYIYLRYYY